MDEAARTGGDAAVALGLPAGWAVMPKPLSRQVHFTAPDGKRFRSVKELAQVLGEVPESLSGGTAITSKQNESQQAEQEVPNLVLSSGGGLLKMVSDVIKSGKTEAEVAVCLGLPTGWRVSPKEASRQVHFITPDGKRFRSVKELGQALGRLPEAFSAFCRDSTPTAPPKKRVETLAGSTVSSGSKRARLEAVGDKSESRREPRGATNAEKVSMFGAAQAALGKYKTDAEVAKALGLPVGWKVSVDHSMKVVFFHPPGRPRIRGAKELTALLGEVPEALGGGQRHSRSDFEEDVSKAVRDYIKEHPKTWSLSMMIVDLSERHGWSREDSREEDALKFAVKAAIVRCGYKGLSAMTSAYSGPLYKGH